MSDGLQSIRILGSHSVQDDDLSNYNGGVVEPFRKVLVKRLDVLTTITMRSSDGADTSQIYLIDGISPENIPVSEQIQLAGTNNVVTAQDFIKIYQIRKMSGSALVGTVTISGVSDIGTLDPSDSDPTEGSVVETTELRSLLVRATSHRAKPKTFHEKLFIVNNGIEATTIVISEFYNPNNTSAFAIDSTANGGTQSVNRTTRSSDIPLNNLNGLPKTIVLQPGEPWGVWIRVTSPEASLWTSDVYVLQITSGSDIQLLDVMIPTASSRMIPEVMNKRYLFPIGGGLSHQFVELIGGRMIEETSVEPDPTTYRGDYYYNARQNRLYKKLNTSTKSVWKVWR